MIYVTTITRHSQPDFWKIPPTWSSFITCITIIVVQVSYRISILSYWLWHHLSQAFYTRRLTKCFTNLCFAIICWILMAYYFVTLVTHVILGQIMGHASPFRIAAIAGFYIMGGVDLLNSLFLCCYLLRSRRYTNPRSAVLAYYMVSQLIRSLQHN